MITAPPNTEIINARVDTIRRDTSALTRRRSTAGRIGIGAALAGAFALSGAGIATASFPATTVDMQGVVKTQYVDDFVQCSEEAGVETVILTGSAATRVLDGWADIDTADYTAVESRMNSTEQGRLGRALSSCQTEIAAKVGEPIL